jgi:hypothetical protein
MKKILLMIAQFFLFFLTFAAGSFFPPFHIVQVLLATPAGTRAFVWDGVALMVLLLAVLLTIEALRKRLRTSGPWTVFAFMLATVLGLAAKLGFMTR